MKDLQDANRWTRETWAPATSFNKREDRAPRRFTSILFPTPEMPKIKYTAFLRGINVGGNKMISMVDLAKGFDSLGFSNVKTLIQSGNVIFEGVPSSKEKLTNKIEKKLEAMVGWPVDVFVMEVAELKSLVDANPFSKAKSGGDGKKYLTLFHGEMDAKSELLRQDDVEIVKIDPGKLYWIALLGKNGRHGMPRILNVKPWAAATTTRNWNTIQRIIAK
jgi:uncharacterized protein (DUF1697 family)